MNYNYFNAPLFSDYSAILLCAGGVIHNGALAAQTPYLEWLPDSEKLLSSAGKKAIEKAFYLDSDNEVFPPYYFVMGDSRFGFIQCSDSEPSVFAFGVGAAALQLGTAKTLLQIPDPYDETVLELPKNFSLWRCKLSFTPIQTRQLVLF